MIERFRYLDRCLSVTVALLEDSPLREDARQVGTGKRGWEHREVKPLTGLLTLERPHPSSAGLFGLGIVAGTVATYGKIVLGYDLERHITERFRRWPRPAGRTCALRHRQCPRDGHS